jgi:hypothetical protein
MTIVLQWKEGCFVANIGMIISQCLISDEDTFAVVGGMVVHNKGKVTPSTGHEVPEGH